MYVRVDDVIVVGETVLVFYTIGRFPFHKEKTTVFVVPFIEGCFILSGGVPESWSNLHLASQHNVCQKKSI